MTLIYLAWLPIIAFLSPHQDSLELLIIAFILTQATVDLWKLASWFSKSKLIERLRKQL